MSPDSPEPETEYQLTPRTEAKYHKIDEEFQMMVQRNQINGQRVSFVYKSNNNHGLLINIFLGRHQHVQLFTTSLSPGQHKLRRQ